VLEKMRARELKREGTFLLSIVCGRGNSVWQIGNPERRYGPECLLSHLNLKLLLFL
jgi:hypothetical protein